MRYFSLKFCGICILILLTYSIVSAQESPFEPIYTMQADSAMDAVAFSPDGMLVASGGRDNTIRVWDTETGNEVMSTEGHADWVTSLVFSGDGRQIISGSRDDTVRVFDAQSGQLLRVLTSHENDVTSVAITPDNTVIASGGRDEIVHLWDMSTGDLLQSLDHFEQSVWHLTFDPTGTILASASEDGTIWLWGLWDENSAWLKRLVGHEASVTYVAFSADGDYLLSGSLDGRINLWDISDLSETTLEPIATLSGHLAPIMSVGFTANSQLAMSASLDGTLRLWDVSDVIELGRELAVIRTTGSPLTNLKYSPQSQLAASVGTDGSLNLWDMSEDFVASIVEENQPVVVAQSTRAIQASSNRVALAPPQVPSIPTTGRNLIIPSAGIRIGVTTFYLNGTTWAIDPWEPIVGHFEGTAWLNRTGNVVIGGHSEMPDGSAGIFNNLYNVGMGDEIFVQDGDLTRRYIVVNILSVDYRDVSVVYPTSHNRLTLITCDIPSFVAEEGVYYERLVVIADEIPH